jgi:hypothetical protein
VDVSNVVFVSSSGSLVLESSGKSLSDFFSCSVVALIGLLLLLSSEG